MSSPGLRPHTALQPVVQAGAGITGASLVTSRVDITISEYFQTFPSILLGEAQPGRHVLGTQHLVPLLPVGQVQLVGEREAGLGAGSVAAQAPGFTEGQLGVAGGRAGPSEVEILHSLLTSQYLSVKDSDNIKIQKTLKSLNDAPCVLSK